jgi:hypothetical protein
MTQQNNIEITHEITHENNEFIHKSAPVPGHVCGERCKIECKFGDDIDEVIDGAMSIIDLPTEDHDGPDPVIENGPKPTVPPNATTKWTDLVVDPAYQINNNTHKIRKKKTKFVPKIGICKRTDYYQISLSGKTHLLHRVLATQYVPNPDPEILTEIDHIDRNRKNNSVSNLRWVSHMSNAENKKGHKGYTYLWTDQLPRFAEPFTQYNDHEIENLYKTFSNKFIKAVIINNQIQYRRMIVCHQNNSSFVQAYDTQGNHIKIYLSMT